MPQTEIEIHFAKMEELSDELLGLAERLKSFTDGKELESISKIKAAWRSDNAEVFAGKEMKVLESIRETAANLNKLSSEIDAKTRQLYELEQRNVLTARTRSYTY